MRITYDPHADAAYIYLDVHPRAPGCVTRTAALSQDVNVDFGEIGGEAGQERVIGIEVLSAAENLGLTKKTAEVEVEILGKPVRVIDR